VLVDDGEAGLAVEFEEFQPVGVDGVDLDEGGQDEGRRPDEHFVLLQLGVAQLQAGVLELGVLEGLFEVEVARGRAVGLEEALLEDAVVEALPVVD